VSERTEWEELRERRMAEPGAVDAYEATRLAFELGSAVRRLREARSWSQAQSAIARFEAGGTVPTLVVLERLARALDAELAVRFTPKAAVA